MDTDLSDFALIDYAAEINLDRLHCGVHKRSYDYCLELIRPPGRAWNDAVVAADASSMHVSPDRLGSIL